MRRVTFTIPDDLEQALVEYQQAQDVPPTITAIVQTALRHYLEQQDPWTRRGYRPAPGPLHFTVDERGSGRSDISVNHDRVPDRIPVETSAG
jgi:hypothetical protein